MAHQPVHGLSDAMVFSTRTRWSITVGAGLIAAGAVVATADLPDDTDTYILAHALASLPILVAVLVVTHRVLGACPPGYRPFWQRAFAADVTSVAVAAIGAVGAALHEPALYIVAGAIFFGGLVLWANAVGLIVRAESGALSPSVDMIDALMALAVLGTPGVLVVAEPLWESTEAAMAIPFALTAIVTPAAIYLSVINLSRVPRGVRAPQAIGAAYATAFTVAANLHLARLVAHPGWPAPVYVTAHMIALWLFLALPLWAHRYHSTELAPPPDSRRARRTSPVPYLSAVVLPPLTAYAFATEADRPWGVPFVAAVLVTVVVLQTVRYRLMSREARRLQDGLAGMAEERRRLLADMVRAMEDDRTRTATELHAQVVGSLATLGSMIQTTHLALPADAASAVRKTFADLQEDLREREEQLRQLMLAMRSPPLDHQGTARPEGNPLTTALRAYASELYQDPSTADVRVDMAPDLELDWTMATIVYRVAQEALLNAARHAEATTVTVEVRPEGTGVTLEVADDGRGFDPGVVEAATGIETMRLFTNLGRGELSITSTPGEGTVVRSRLAVRPERDDRREVTAPDGSARPERTAAPEPRHLELVPPLDEDPEPHR